MAINNQGNGKAPAGNVGMYQPMGASQTIESKYTNAAQVKLAAQKQKSKDYTNETKDLNKLLKTKPKYRSGIANPEFEKLRAFSSSTSDSPYFSMLKDQQAQRSNQQVQGVDASSQGQLSNAYSNLAMGGGLSSGSRERLAGDASMSSLAARQQARQAGSDAMSGLGLEQEKQRMGAQESVLNALSGEAGRQSGFEQEQWKTGVDAQQALKKSQAERDVAASNACFANGSLIIDKDGKTVAIEDVRVGDLVVGGVVYTIQQSLAPSKIHCYKGTYLTGGHAVFENKEWKRVKHSEHGIEVETPEHVKYIYNLGVTDHFLKTPDGVTFSDLHETDDYEFLTDEESLDALNKAWSVEGFDEFVVR